MSMDPGRLNIVRIASDPKSAWALGRECSIEAPTPAIDKLARDGAREVERLQCSVATPEVLAGHTGANGYSSSAREVA